MGPENVLLGLLHVPVVLVADGAITTGLMDLLGLLLELLGALNNEGLSLSQLGFGWS